MKIVLDTKKMFPAVLVVALGAALTVGLTACDTDTPQDSEDNNVSHQQDIYNRVQPVHEYAHSVYRDNLQAVEDTEANGLATTSYDVNPVGTLLFSCPSLGLPVHATDQLSNPLKSEWGGHSGGVAVGQMENTGVYTGQSSGTSVLCVRPDGAVFVYYGEGTVSATTAPSHWDAGLKQIVIDGDPAVTPTIHH